MSGDIPAGPPVAVRAAGVTALLLTAAAAGFGEFVAALAPVAAGAIAVALLAVRGRRTWGAAGVLYAGTVLLAPTVLRRDEELGLVAINAPVATKPQQVDRNTLKEVLHGLRGL